MSPAYIRGVKDTLGNAAIVFDKYHVVCQVNEGVEEVRRLEYRADAQAREHLAKTQWIWRKNPENWTAKESRRWEQLDVQNLATGLAYQMRLVL